MKPFLFLGTRAEDDAADDEFAAVRRYARLDPGHLERHRLEREPLGDVDPGEFSGIILGGGPFNNSDPEESKSAVQRRVETELRALAEKVVADDVPFLGACYGIGTLGSLPGGVVDRTYAEPVSAVEVHLTAEGRDDPLFGVLSSPFAAFLGHKEAVRRLPDGAVLLASSTRCPVQGFRLGRNVYATQFHPELDVTGLHTRIDVYRDHGYFHPSEVETLKAMAEASAVHEPPLLLTRFVELYAAGERAGTLAP